MGVQIKRTKREVPQAVTDFVAQTGDPATAQVQEVMELMRKRYNQLSEEGMLYADWWELGSNGTVFRIYDAKDKKKWSHMRAHMKAFWKVYG